MSLFSRLLHRPPPPLSRLWGFVVATARKPCWYSEHLVADTVDGRFDMVALVTSLVLVELQKRDRRREVAALTERFVEDMEGSLRESGIGDLVIGKHVGRMVGALDGRLGAYRQAFAGDAPETLLAGALLRNVYRGKAGEEAASGLAVAVRALAARIAASSDDELLTGAVR